MSTSMGMEVLNRLVVPLLRSLFNQLSRLSSAPGDDTFGTQLNLITFNSNATNYSIQTRGKNTTQIRAEFESVFLEENLHGGSCISCGLDLATSVLIQGSE